MSTRRPSSQRVRSAGGRAGGVRRSRRRWWAALFVVALVVLALASSLLLRPGAGSASLPGPIGGPEAAQDVNTLVGKPAPAFTLPDSEGQRYTVTPGKGRPIVLVSHMGIT